MLEGKRAMRHLNVGRLGAVAVIALFAGVVFGQRSALAVHESICITAINSGMYNVITGSGTINGTSGNDVIIWGDGGNDDTSGSSGNDAIVGGGGNDDCSGGSGKDTQTNCESFNGVP
jgi:Ca2+-binding RTX toxin-like protein